jgi:nucleoside-diphosphate-sugar epimerase
MPSLERILVPGANGFVGRAVVEDGVRRGLAMTAVTRRAAAWPAGVNAVILPGGLEQTDWSPALTGAGAVVHCAARVHVMRETSADPLADFRRMNVAGSVRLAEQAAAAGVRRFVLISTVKVNGESTVPGRPFTADDPPAPVDPYGISKWEAEQALHGVAAVTGMEVVVIRPSLVYGPGVKANFAALLRWVGRGRPLPFGAVHNQRSLVALGNLVDLIHLCVQHPAARGETFLAADGEDVSTADLCRRIGAVAGRPARLLQVPVFLLEAGAALVGRRGVAQRLCGSLQVDTEKARTRLGWRPPLGLDAGLRLALEGMT